MYIPADAASHCTVLELIYCIICYIKKTGPSYAAFTVNCPSPASIDKKKQFQLSIKWLGGEDAVAIPFNGAEENDVVTFDMTWFKLRSVANGHVIVDVDGLDVDVKHTCKYTQPDNEEITKTTDASFIAGGKGKKLDCGVQPTGYVILDLPNFI